jgi:hypothetical protein
MAEENLKVEEATDGSATVELPADMAPEQAPEEEKLAEGGDVEEAEEASPSGDNFDDSPDDTDAIREMKRQKRKARREYHKKVQEEKDQRLQILQRQNQELMERLSVVERRTHGSEVARINEQLKEQEAKILFAKNKIKEATETGNGELLASAQEMWYEAKRDYEALDSIRKQAVTPRQQQQTIQAPDPMIQVHAANWMGRNSWYKANGNDMDSEIAKKVDQALVDEGWNPSTADYWEELDNRLQRYLPHRYNDDDGEEFQKPKRHRSVVTSTGRESVSSNKNTFVLSPEQVRAMKDAGMWDDPDKRQKMIKRYAQEARLQRN